MRVGLAGTLALLAVAVAAGLIGMKPERADAIGYPCEPPAGPCQAHFWGVDMAAHFIIDGIFPIQAIWNFDSQTQFYAWPQSGHNAEVYYMQHAVWTSSTWPYGTWNKSQTTKLRGVRFDVWGCSSSPCDIAYIPLGPNYRSGGEFDHQYAAYGGPSYYADADPKVYALAGLYPSSGAAAAWNNTRNECKQLTPSGAVGC